MEEIKISLTQIAIYTTIINVVLGFLFGSFPLILGIKMKNRNYGVYGFIGSIIGGAVLGVLVSYPIAIISTWLILRKPKETVEAMNENSIEAETVSHSKPS